jgi:hypothetical protein
MNTWEIVDTSDNRVVSSFTADDIRYQGSKGGIPFVIGIRRDKVADGNGISSHPLTAVIPLTPNRFVRLSLTQQGGSQ